MRTKIAAFIWIGMLAPFTTALAQGPGDLASAVDAAVAWERHQAAASAQIDVGDYRAIAILSPAESWYEWSPAGLILHEPPPDTVHVKVILRDLKDGRVVPELAIRGSVIAGDRTDLVQKPMPFGWYPAVNGYGENFPATERGLYHVRIEIKPASFPRHDRDRGKRYTELLRAEFPPMQLDPAALRRRAPLTDSDEGTGFASAQGVALDRALKQAWADTPGGAESESGDYRVACFSKPFEGYWFVDQGKLQYRAPSQQGDRDTEIRIVVRDSRTGRFVPGLNVRVSVRDRAGAVLATAPEGFMWDPLLSHYGENWRIPHTGLYAVTVQIDAPKWRRYGKQAGRTFGSSAVVEFAGVRMESSEATAP